MVGQAYNLGLRNTLNSKINQEKLETVNKSGFNVSSIVNYDKSIWYDIMLDRIKGDHSVLV